jgi:hypothetical protein
MNIPFLSLNKKSVLHLDSSGEIYNTVLKNAEEPHALVRSTMEYGSIIWDPYTHQEITKLESIQGEARFIAKDYKSREEGCMTKMLNELNLPTLLSSRQKQRLIFFYKVVEGQVPAMPPDLFIKKQKPKRQIGAK